MIPLVLQSLQAQGLLAPDAEPEMQITLTSGDALHVYMYEGAQLRYFVKCSKHVSLADEYERHTRARRTHGETVSLPRAFIRTHGWDILAADGANTRPVRRTELFGARAHPGLSDALETFCARQARLSGYTDRPRRTERLFLQLSELLSTRSLSPVRDTVLSAAAHARLLALPSVLQHGDFVVNNLAWVDRKLMVFDYEDFGRLHLPGFDLACLYGSIHLFEPAPLIALARASEGEIDRMSPWLRRCCAAHGISLGDFRAMLPIHLAGFALLKRNYSLDVRRIAERALIDFVTATHG